MSDIKLFAWGANNYGQLANGQPCEQLEWPFSIKGQNLAQNLVNPEISVVLGGGHSFLIEKSNSKLCYKNCIALTLIRAGFSVALYGEGGLNQPTGLFELLRPFFTPKSVQTESQMKL